VSDQPETTLGRIIVGRVSQVVAYDVQIVLDDDLDGAPIHLPLLALHHADVGPGAMVAVRFDDDGRVVGLERLDRR
jgi:hypothetical protein